MPCNLDHLKLKIISFTLVYVPIIRPAAPNTINKQFFSNVTFVNRFSAYKTHISIIAGNPMAKTDRQSAPISEINRPSRGIAAANKTVNV